MGFSFDIPGGLDAAAVTFLCIMAGAILVVVAVPVIMAIIGSRRR